MGLSVHSMRFYKPELVEYAYCLFMPLLGAVGGICVRHPPMYFQMVPIKGGTQITVGVLDRIQIESRLREVHQDYTQSHQPRA